MSLLDTNIETIIITKIEDKNKKLWISEGNPSWEFKDEQNNILGKLKVGNKKDKWNILYNSDETILIKLPRSGYFGVGLNLYNSDEKPFAKIKNAKEVGMSLMDSKDEELLTSKMSSVYSSNSLLDNKEKRIAELIFSKFKWKRVLKGEEPSILNILDSDFNRILILGFVISWLLRRAGIIIY